MILSPWLCMSGVELGNAMRTLTYLRRGLGSQWIDIPAAAELVTENNCREEVVGDEYSDSYSDIYGGSIVTVCDPVDVLDPPNLACYCEPIDEGPYLGPAEDDAPWYDPDRPESAEFLGLVPSEVRLLTTVRRSAQANGWGSSIGPQSSTGMVVAVRADMHAASPAGMEWGERWLAEVLGAGGCDERLDLEVLLACNDDDSLFRTLPDVGLIDGPVYGPVGEVPECSWQQVAFQLASASPWLLGVPVVAYDGALGAGHYRQVVTDEWTGDAGIRVEVMAGPAGVAGIVIEGLIGAGANCPPSGAVPCWRYEVPTLPGGHRLVIDGALEDAYVENPATGEITGGLELFEFAGRFEYPQAASCSQVCVHVAAATGGSTATTRISYRSREL